MLFVFGEPFRVGHTSGFPRTALRFPLATSKLPLVVPVQPFTHIDQFGLAAAVRAEETATDEIFHVRGTESVLGHLFPDVRLGAPRLVESLAVAEHSCVENGLVGLGIEEGDDLECLIDNLVRGVGSPDLAKLREQSRFGRDSATPDVDRSRFWHRRSMVLRVHFDGT